MVRCCAFLTAQLPPVGSLIECTRTLTGPREGARDARRGRPQVLRGVRRRAARRLRAARRQRPLPARAGRRAARLHGRRRHLRGAAEGRPRAANGEPVARRLPQAAHRHAPGERTLMLYLLYMYCTVHLTRVECALYSSALCSSRAPSWPPPVIIGD